MVVQTVKNLPAIWETWVQSLGWEDPLEREMATLSSILAWEIPWMEEPGGLQRSQRGHMSQILLSDFHIQNTAIRTVSQEPCALAGLGQ